MGCKCIFTSFLTIDNSTDSCLLPDDPELAPYVRRARELAYGWPGGTPPGEDA